MRSSWNWLFLDVYVKKECTHLGELSFALLFMCLEENNLHFLSPLVKTSSNNSRNGLPWKLNQNEKCMRIILFYLRLRL